MVNPTLAERILAMTLPEPETLYQADREDITGYTADQIRALLAEAAAMADENDKRPTPRKIMADMLRVLRGIEQGSDEHWKFIANVCANADEWLEIPAEQEGQEDVVNLVDVDEVKQLCRDFSSRTGNVYIGDVEASLDGLVCAHRAAQEGDASAQARIDSFSLCYPWGDSEAKLRRDGDSRNWMLMRNGVQIRYLNKYENNFVNSAIAASTTNQKGEQT